MTTMASGVMIDPFTIEIIKEGLNAIGDEMFVSLQRTSMSPIIYEVLDYCCGITDERGQLLAQGNGVAGFTLERQADPHRDEPDDDAQQ